MKNAWTPLKRISMNTSRRNWILDEPSCRASMKNSGKQRNEKKEKLKTQGESLQWFRWSSVIIRAWNSGKERRALETKNLIIVNKLRKKRLTYGWNKNKNYIMLILHQLNWCQPTDLAHYLFLYQGLRAIWHKLGKVFDEPLVGFGKQRMSWYDNHGIESWANHHKNWKWTKRR